MEKNCETLFGDDRLNILGLSNVLMFYECGDTQEGP